ncbi:MAG: MAG1210 family protein, partial [Fusobacterium sp.]
SRVEYIPVRADNGRVYDVPVHWVEYVPLTAYNKMEIKKLDVKEDEFENYVNNEDFSKVVNNKRYGYKNNLFAVFNDEGELNCEEILSKIKK